MSRRFFPHLLAGIILLFSAAPVLGVCERVVGVVTFVAADRRRARLRQVPVEEAPVTQPLILVEFPAFGRVQLAVDGAVVQLVHCSASKALARRCFWSRRRRALLLCCCTG